MKVAKNKIQKTCLTCGRKTCDRQPEDVDPVDCKDWKNYRTTIFAYKGFIGIKSSTDAKGLLNNPLALGQCGFVVDAKYVDVSPEALELLKKLPKSGDCIGDFDIHSCIGDVPVVVSWLGGSLKMLDLKQDISGSRNYDPSLLKPCQNVEIDPDFITAIDSRP